MIPVYIEMILKSMPHEALLDNLTNFLNQYDDNDSILNIITGQRPLVDESYCITNRSSIIEKATYEVCKYKNRTLLDNIVYINITPRTELNSINKVSVTFYYTVTRKYNEFKAKELGDIQPLISELIERMKVDDYKLSDLDISLISDMNYVNGVDDNGSLDATIIKRENVIITCVW